MDSQQLLNNSGIKLTVSRREVLNSLSSNPLSAQEVYSILKQKGLTIDLVTVYRTLELFLKEGIIEKIQLEDKITRYELVENHHHHLICLSCALMQDVEIDEEAFVAKIEKKTHFKLKRHSLEFFGICKNCQ